MSGTGCWYPDRPGIKIHGDVFLGHGTDICEPADVNGTGSRVVIGAGCDIAAFVTINVADSSRRCVGKAQDIERGEVLIGERTFIGTGAVIIGPCRIGSRVRIGALCFIKGCDVPDDVVIPPGTHLLHGNDTTALTAQSPLRFVKQYAGLAQSRAPVPNTPEVPGASPGASST